MHAQKNATKELDASEIDRLKKLLEVEAIKEALDGIPEPRLLEIKSLN